MLFCCVAADPNNAPRKGICIDFWIKGRGGEDRARGAVARKVVLENAKRVRMTVGKDGRRMRLI